MVYATTTITSDRRTFERKRRYISMRTPMSMCGRGVGVEISGYVERDVHRGSKKLNIIYQF